METTSETAGLFDELFERLGVLADLDGPQVEAWVSGLFPLFDDSLTLEMLVERCATTESPAASLLSTAIAELTTGLDDQAAAEARAAVRPELLPVTAEQIGSSDLADAWLVQAPFGNSIVLGFTNRTQTLTLEAGDSEAGDSEVGETEPVDLRHSILIEIGAQGTIEDLQLAGPPQALLTEASSADHRVVVTTLQPAEAVDRVIAAWPVDVAGELGPGFGSNQQFVRRRLLVSSGQILPLVVAQEQTVDVRRGLDDAEYEAANRAALSTLGSAIDTVAATPAVELTPLQQVWVGVIRGDGGELSARERDALLWLEWADWLGAGIGLVRAGAESSADGATLVDHVNRCPEVSSSIDKRDRDYAEWAFEVALDLLQDAGAVDNGVITRAGYEALAPAMVAAWSG